MSRKIRCGLVAVLAGLPVIAPQVAGAQIPAPPTLAAGSWWFESGLGPSLVRGPSGSGSGVSMSIGTGWMVAPQWAIGLEVGVTGNVNGCEINECEDFGPDVTRTMLVAEYIPVGSPWRLRLAAGTFGYCAASWVITCSDTASGPGAGMYATRHWALTRRAVWSVGLRAGVETAHLPARRALDVPAFWHSTALLSVQLRRN